MTKVIKIDWTVKTGDQGWSGTDTPVQIEIYRDHELIKSLHLEPGRTPRLDRSELATYLWEVTADQGNGPLDAASSFPQGYQDFPEGIAGHLRVKVIARGDDAWEKEWIESTVHTAELQPAQEGQAEAAQEGQEQLVWVETRRTFRFGRAQVLSTDPVEGARAITLLYDG